MKHFVVLAAIMLFASACSHLPQRKPVADPLATQIFSACEKVFIPQKIQLLHRITATLPTGQTETFLGISQVDPNLKKLHCVLMTIEGLVLLEAEDNGGLNVKRAVPPFDRPGVAAGMMADIRLIFFPPASTRKEAAVEDQNCKICRYYLADDKVQEILLLSHGQTMIQLYNKTENLYRSVRFNGVEKPFNLAKQMEINAHGITGYKLKMTLIEAEPIAP